MYLAPAPAADAAPIVTATGGFGSLPVEPTVFTCTCGGVHYVCKSSVRCTCICLVYIAPAPAVYVTSAPAVESTRRHQQCTLHLRLPLSTSRQHNQCLTPRQHWYCVLCASACILCLTCCDCNRLLRFSPSRAHRLHLHLWWRTSRRHHRYTWHCTCRGLHRASTFRECFSCTFGDVHRAGISSERCTSPVVEHIAPAQAVSYADKIFESSSHSDDVFLRQGVESNALLSLSWSIPFILVTRCR